MHLASSNFAVSFFLDDFFGDEASEPLELAQPLLVEQRLRVFDAQQRVAPLLEADVGVRHFRVGDVLERAAVHHHRRQRGRDQAEVDALGRLRDVSFRLKGA